MMTDELSQKIQEFQRYLIKTLYDYIVLNSEDKNLKRTIELEHETIIRMYVDKKGDVRFVSVGEKDDEELDMKAISYTISELSDVIFSL